tara:strand:- start:152 stop:349 length:198 start_codon:yes stop_codon:yes gene_type:complete
LKGEIVKDTKKEWFKGHSPLVDKYAEAIQTVLTLDWQNFGLLSDDTIIELDNLINEYIGENIKFN